MHIFLICAFSLLNMTLFGLELNTMLRRRHHDHLRPETPRSPNR